MKAFKKILCLTLVVLFCFSLIGCDAIDEMRQRQIHFNEKANLVYEDKEFMLLPYCEAFNPDFSDGTFLSITEKDVPVLLADMYGTPAELSKDKKFISASDKFGATECYARADIYEEILARINNGDYFDGYCYNYSYMDEEYEYKTGYKFISDKAQLVIDQVIAGTPLEDADISLMYEFSVLDLWYTSKDGLFQQYALTIFKTDSYVYIGSDESQEVFKVPEDCVLEIEKLITEYQTLIESLNKDFEFEE